MMASKGYHWTGPLKNCRSGRRRFFQKEKNNHDPMIIWWSMTIWLYDDQAFQDGKSGDWLCLFNMPTLTEHCVYILKWSWRENSHDDWYVMFCVMLWIATVIALLMQSCVVGYIYQPKAFFLQQISSHLDHNPSRPITPTTTATWPFQELS